MLNFIFVPKDTISKITYKRCCLSKIRIPILDFCSFDWKLNVSLPETRRIGS